MLQLEYKVRKILIVDWDIHHGNGTQAMFYDDPDVLYFSIHRYDNAKFYPQNVNANYDWVSGKNALGKNVNVPWPEGGFRDHDYLHVFNRLLMPIAMEFQPEIVIVSCGFDAAHGDPVGGCNLSPLGYAHLTHALTSLANGKVLLALEGGYNLESISASALECVKVLAGCPPPMLEFESPKLETYQVVENVIKHHCHYWKNLYPKYPRCIRNQFVKIQHSSIAHAPLGNAITAYAGVELENYCGLHVLPLTDPALEEVFRNKLHVSPDILQPVDTIIVYLHDHIDMRCDSGPLQMEDIDSSVTLVSFF
jgi:histone deacetylase 6